MFLIPWILSAFFIAIVFSARIIENDSSQNIWAVLVAGSKNWYRYRHQSNVCHAYKILRENGIPKNRIITFMYDDIAYNSENPEPGVIRNEPNGINVYKGVPIDYTGNNVRKDVFLNVLRGNKKRVIGIGSGRVVTRQVCDYNILIFYTGLGDTGLIGFPNSGKDTTLHNDELVETFKQMHNRDGYKNILMFLEASFSGTMFQNYTLPHNIGVLAIAACGPEEDTYGTFCNTDIDTCLAGLFSYAWMNYAENSPDGLRKDQSVFDHFDHIRDDVANTGKEHPQLYGDWSVGNLPISQFIGYQIRSSSSSKTTKIELISEASNGPSITRISENDPNYSSQNIWAVLVAGSHRWIRYRHQSNVCHAYKILRENGIPKNRIITFMYDDIAYNSENPEPGVIRNEPNGINVYEGVPIDYTGENVRKDVFLNVLQGNTTEVKGIGSGRVVLSTKKDNILIFHTGLGDHGGLIEFPDSGEDTDLHGDELVAAFKQLYNRNSYKNILMFLESSHSGAMFENSTLPHNINVLAITAGGPDEDTYGTFCNTYIDPCLAGLFTYTWMNYADNNPDSLRKIQTVFDHFDYVRDTVSNTGLEHPQLYGDRNIGNLPISQFIGYQIRSSSSSKTTKIELISEASNGHSTYDKDARITAT
ncbi:hypothetical protein ACI65C_005367 [Semiaphis heraclei]